VKKARNFFFFEKKKQKTFIPWLGGTQRPRSPNQMCKSLFASFSSEKEESLSYPRVATA
jgi:hypothetical protein